MAIKCCYGCKPPKRHAGCHATCPEYIAENKQHTEEREASYRKRVAVQGVYAMRDEAVTKALKHIERKKMHR